MGFEPSHRRLRDALMAAVKDGQPGPVTGSSKQVFAAEREIEADVPGNRTK